jgi:hypothetical protein
MTAKSHDQRTTELLTTAVAAHDSDRISLDELMAPLQRRAFGFLLLLIAVPNFIPVPLGLGGITGTLACLLGLQMLIGLEQPWLPRWLKRRSLKRSSLQHFLQRIAPITRWLEKLCKPRLERLTTHPLTIASGLMMILLGVLLMLPIPFTNYLFGVMLLAFAFALIERDGGLLLMVWVATGASVGLSASVARSLWAMLRDWF